MKWSKAQKSLLDLAKQPIPHGTWAAVDKVSCYNLNLNTARACEVVAETQIESVMDYVTRVSKQGTWTGPRNIVINAQRLSWALSSLQAAAGGTKGRDIQARAFKAFEKLKENNDSLTLWLKEFRCMNPRDQEGLVFLLSYTAWALEIPIRVVCLVGTVWGYVREIGCSGVKPCEFSSLLRAREMQLTRSGLDETQAEDEAQDQPLLRDVKVG